MRKLIDIVPDENSQFGIKDLCENSTMNLIYSSNNYNKYDVAEENGTKYAKINQNGVQVIQVSPPRFTGTVSIVVFFRKIHTSSPIVFSYGNASPYILFCYRYDSDGNVVIGQQQSGEAYYSCGNYKNAVNTFAKHIIQITNNTMVLHIDDNLVYNGSISSASFNYDSNYSIIFGNWYYEPRYYQNAGALDLARFTLYEGEYIGEKEIYLVNDSAYGMI